MPEERMYKPGLIIGLGGTGVLTLRHLKAELLGTEQRKMPDNVRILALDTVQEQGRSFQAEKTKLAALRTELEPGEYFWIGGDVYDFAEEVQDRKHPHIGTWFQAETYLKLLPRSVFTLQQGAGQLRQFGRLAVFKDVAAPSMSNIKNLISRAISDIRRAQTVPTLDVFLVGSLAGGTGAGMFADMAHLVRRIAAEEHRMGVRLRGFLVLPEAFKAIPGGVKPSMRARAFACLRENKRFMVDWPWDIGYPLYYHERDEGPIWHHELKTKLFDFVYYVDGQRTNNPLTDALPEFGVTASIGDAVAAMLDRDRTEGVEDRYAQHGANVVVAAGQEASQTTIGRTSFDGAIGTYTVTLPMHHILEGLSYRLALEALEVLLAPSAKDDDGFPTALAPDRNQEAGNMRGREGASAFLSSDSVQAWGVEERVSNTPFFKELLRVAIRYGPANPGLIAELAARDPATWEGYLDPPGADPAVMQVRTQVQKELSSRLSDAVPKGARGERPEEAMGRILAQTERYKAAHLGREDARTGQRIGGSYRGSLEQFTDFQMSRFRAMLRIECLNALNGGLNPNDPQQVKKGAKPGYLMDFLGGLETIVATFIKALTEAKSLRDKQQLKGAAEGAVMSTRRALEQKPGGWGAGRRQEDYLRAEQRLIDVLKTDICSDVVRSLAQEMLEHVQLLKSSVESWTRTLALGYDSLYARVARGRRQVAEMVQAENLVRVRNIVWEEEYERALYEKYAQEQQEGLEAVLNGLTWKYEEKRAGARTIYGFQFKVQTPGAEELLGLTGQEHNLEVLLDPCRAIFSEAWQAESVLKYLMRRYPIAEDLADELWRQSGTLLEVRGGTPVPANYLHVAYGREPAERDYLDRVKLRLANNSGAQGELSAVIDSSDHFRLRLVNTQDLVPLDQTDAWVGGQDPYRAYVEEVQTREGGRGRLGRETLHVFPAEVNAAKFEARLSELRQPPRELHNDLVLQLEDTERLRLFVRSWTFGVIRQEHEARDGGHYNYYALVLPPEQAEDVVFGTRGERQLYLTSPKPGDPDSLEALKAFNYTRKDVRPEHYEVIDYERTRRALTVARQNKVKDILKQEGGELAGLEEEQRPILAQRLAGLPDADRQYARRLLAEHAHLKQTQGELHKQLDKATTDLQRDTATVFWLALGDDIRGLEVAIDDRLKRVSRL